MRLKSIVAVQSVIPDDAFTAVHGGDIGEVRDGRTAGLLDFINDLGGRAVVLSGTVGVDAGVVHDDARALGSGQKRALAPNPAASAGHRHYFAFEQTCHSQNSFKPQGHKEHKAFVRLRALCVLV